VIQVEGTGPFAGHVGLWRADFEATFTPAVEIGWLLRSDLWGHGYGTEAARLALADRFVRLGLDEIVSLTSAINRRSRRVMERLGMKRETNDDFDRPAVAAPSPLRAHVLYRLTGSDWALDRPEMANDTDRWEQGSAAPTRSEQDPVGLDGARAVGVEHGEPHPAGRKVVEGEPAQTIGLHRSHVVGPDEFDGRHRWRDELADESASALLDHHDFDLHARSAERHVTIDVIGTDADEPDRRIEHQLRELCVDRSPSEGCTGTRCHVFRHPIHGLQRPSEQVGERIIAEVLPIIA